MKKVIIAVVVLLVLAAAGAAGWYFFLKKSAEGQSCGSIKKCQTNLNCLNKTCSSGKNGSYCNQKSDCQTSYCVANTCTEGKVNDACTTYKDCDKGLLCQKGVCATPPDYSKYFSKITISKMKPGLPPSTDNPLTVTSAFTTSDAIEVDFTGVESTTIGEYYIEIVNSVTGETARNTKGMMDTKFEGKDTGMGTDMSGIAAGQYDLNVYFKNELVYSTQITVNQ